MPATQSIDALNSIVVAYGGTGGHYFSIDALNEWSGLVGGSTGHAFKIDALNDIAIALGGDGGHTFTIDALNEIAGLEGGAAAYVQNIDALNDIVSDGPPLVDNLGPALAALETASKLYSAWYLPVTDPDQYLTLNGLNVEGWTASHGIQKVNLAELVTRPTWNASLRGGKGGIVFNGTDQCLTGTGNVSNWPTSNIDLLMVVAAKNTADSAGTRTSFCYGASTSGARAVRRVLDGADNRGRVSLNTISVTASIAVLEGAHTQILHGIHGTALRHYQDGALDGSTFINGTSITRTRTRIGASPAASADEFWLGEIYAAAILGPTAVLQDALDLEALMRAEFA